MTSTKTRMIHCKFWIWWIQAQTLRCTHVWNRLNQIRSWLFPTQQTRNISKPKQAVNDDETGVPYYCGHNKWKQTANVFVSFFLVDICFCMLRYGYIHHVLLCVMLSNDCNVINKLNRSTVFVADNVDRNYTKWAWISCFICCTMKTFFKKNILRGKLFYNKRRQLPPEVSFQYRQKLSMYYHFLVSSARQNQKQRGGGRRGCG